MGYIVIEIFRIDQAAITKNHTYLRFEHWLVKEARQPAGLTVFQRFKDPGSFIQGRSVIFDGFDNDAFGFSRGHLAVADPCPTREGNIHDRFHVTWPDAAHVNQTGVEEILIKRFFYRFTDFHRAGSAPAGRHAEIDHRDGAVFQFLPFFSGGLLQCGKIRHTPPEFSSGASW